MAFGMNPQRAKHMGQEHGGSHEAPAKGDHEGGGKHPHSIHIHHAGDGEPHPDNQHHVHIHHGDGTHEHSDHGSFEEAMNHAHSIGGMHGEPSQTHGEPDADDYGM